MTPGYMIHISRWSLVMMIIMVKIVAGIGRRGTSDGG